jgi:hypothetical protein
MRPFIRIALLTLLVARGAFAFPTPGPGRDGRGHNVSRALRKFVQTTDTHSLGGFTMPANAKQYRYVLVKGVIGDDYPRYMTRTIEGLWMRGLKAEYAPIDTGQSVAHNSAIIEQMIKTSDRPIIFIAHSKGVADTTDAIGRLAKENPELVKSQVRGLVSLEGAYRGSKVADALASNKWGQRVMKTLATVVRGSVDAGLDLRTSVREAAVADHPMPTKLVPTVSFIGYQLSPWRSTLGLGIRYLMKNFGQRSDGLVAHQSAYIDGSDYAYGNFDHAVGAFGRYSDRITLGLVAHVLEQPQTQLASPPSPANQ